MSSQKWDMRFLELARMISGWSKDPSTQTGAVITQNRRIVATGYNGMAQGVEDSVERYNDRELKYKLIIHCERNAIIFADRHALLDSTLYTWPFLSCGACASIVIQAGITRVVAPQAVADKAERWKDDFDLARQLFREAGVAVVEYQLDLSAWGNI